MDPPVARRATMVEPRVEPAGALWARPDVVAAPTGELRQAPRMLSEFCVWLEEPRSSVAILWLRGDHDEFCTCKQLHITQKYANANSNTDYIV